MKKCFPILVLLGVLGSCTGIDRLELSEEVKSERTISKPMIITSAEITAVANEIGDSLVENMVVGNDTTFAIEEHKVSVIGRDHVLLKDSLLAMKFEAYKDSFDKGFKDIPGIVSFDKRSDFAAYEVFKATSDSSFKMIKIDVSLREVTKKIAKERK